MLEHTVWYTSQKYTIDCFTDVMPIYSYRHGFISIINYYYHYYFLLLAIMQLLDHCKQFNFFVLSIYDLCT